MTKMKIELIRFFENDIQTLGKFRVLDKIGTELFQGFMLELADKGNQNSISRIPEGIYDVVKRNSPKYGDHFHLINVPGRSYILIHVGNYYTNTRGCLLPGEGIYDINGDGLKDITNSANTMKKLNKIMDDEFTIEIKDQI